MAKEISMRERKKQTAIIKVRNLWESTPSLTGLELFNLGHSKDAIREAKKQIQEKKNKKRQEKKETQEDSIKSFLKENRTKYESLGCGCNDGIYYFGTKLVKEGEPYTAIVTSNKKVYIKKKNNDEIRNLFGLNYKGEFFEESLDNIMANDCIKKWLFENTNSITIKSVYEKLIEEFKKYIYFEDKRKYSLLACYRIAGFFMPIWKARGRLFLRAEMGSAKSRLSLILHNTGFNSIALGDWTLAYLRAIIESTRGETHIDDFETLGEEQKNATTRLVKVGYMRGYKAGKMSEGNKRKPEVNDLFNTTTLNNTEGLDFITADRTITVRIPKISKKEFDKEPDFDLPIWKELRDDLYILGLKYPDKVKEVYETITSEKIRGRLLSIIKPELTIAKLISEKLFEDIEKYWTEEIEQTTNIDYETDWYFLALKEIYKLLSTHSTLSTNSTHSTLSTTNYFNLSEDIIEKVGRELYEEEEFKKKKRSISIVVGKALSTNPIFRKREVRGVKQYSVNADALNDFLEAKGFLKPILEILQVERVDSVECVGGKMGKGNQEEFNPKEVLK